MVNAAAGDLVDGVVVLDRLSLAGPEAAQIGRTHRGEPPSPPIALLRVE